MRPYEVMVIFESDLDEEGIRSSLDRVGEIVSNTGGKVAKVDHWGKRRFAYEMRHRTDGYYVVMRMSASIEAMDELSRVLSLTDEVVRHKVIRVPEIDAGTPKVVSADV